MDDLISRQAAIEAVRRSEALDRAFGYGHAVDALRELPSAQRTGRWIDAEKAPFDMWYATCSECGKRQTLERLNYCPNCGSRMETKDHE